MSSVIGRARNEAFYKANHGDKFRGQALGFMEAHDPNVFCFGRHLRLHYARAQSFEQDFRGIVGRLDANRKGPDGLGPHCNRREESIKQRRAV